jgi:hypothetical protein
VDTHVVLPVTNNTSARSRHISQETTRDKAAKQFGTIFTLNNCPEPVKPTGAKIRTNYLLIDNSGGFGKFA